MRHSHSHACVRQHMSMPRTCMHAHMVAHVHTRVHAQEDTYTSAHTARTHDIRIRTCATPGSTYTRHSTFQNRQPPPKAPCVVSIYHNLPTKTGLHRHISGCPSRHALADRALKTMMPHQGGEKCESPRTGPAARAALAHAVLSRTTAVRRFASPHLALPLPPRVGQPCT